MSKAKTPIVAIVGRANVGKSSLFNAILGYREAIVADEPGTTRDSITAKASYEMLVPTDVDAGQGESEKQTKSYTTYDEGASEDSTQPSATSNTRVSGSARKQGVAMRRERKDWWLVDTAGIKPAEDDFELTIQEQIQQASDSADIILVVVSADTQITEDDRRVAKMALKSKKEVILVVNKFDKTPRADLNEWRRLGIKTIFATSTTQKMGIQDLLEEIAGIVPKSTIKQDENRIKVAILGRPNVGKSYLFNTLLNKQKAVVADVAGTTRDVNKSTVKYHQKEIELLDTAGLRRSGRVERGVEHFSVLRTMSAIEEADICLLLLDVNELSTALDQKIAGMIKEAGKGLVLVVSKWDSVLDKDAYTRDMLAPQIRREFDFVPWAPLIFTSSVTGQNVTKLFDIITDIAKNRALKISTPELNRWLRHNADNHPPAGLKNRHPKLNYIVQTEEPTPSFKIFGAHTKLLHWSYKRYLEKNLRLSFGFEGTAVKMYFIEKHEDRLKKDKK